MRGIWGGRELVRIAILTVDCHQTENEDEKRVKEQRERERRKQHPVLFPASVEGGESYRSRRSTAN
jgi:hypothetical protein